MPGLNSEEKKKFIKDILSQKYLITELAKIYKISIATANRYWSDYRKYMNAHTRNKIKSSEENIIDTIEEKYPSSDIQLLKLELIKRDIEIERLKKGYNVKGVGQKKEFISLSKKNTK